MILLLLGLILLEGYFLYKFKKEITNLKKWESDSPVYEVTHNGKVIILSVFTIAIIQYFKEDKWKEQQSKRN